MSIEQKKSDIIEKALNLLFLQNGDSIKSLARTNAMDSSNAKPCKDIRVPVYIERWKKQEAHMHELIAERALIINIRDNGQSLNDEGGAQNEE